MANNNLIINKQVQPFLANGQMIHADEELRDIKGFQAIIVPDWIWYLLTFIVVAILVFFIYKYLKSRKQEVKLTLAELTIRRLQDLDITKNAKSFYLDYSEIVRVYLEERLNLHVLDKTAEELRPVLISEHRIMTTQAVLLTKIFYRADLAKFAKQKFSDQVKAKDIEATVAIIKSIENTILVEEQKKNENEKRGLNAVR